MNEFKYINSHLSNGNQEDASYSGVWARIEIWLIKSKEVNDVNPSKYTAFNTCIFLYLSRYGGWMWASRPKRQNYPE